MSLRCVYEHPETNRCRHPDRIRTGKLAETLGTEPRCDLMIVGRTCNDQKTADADDDANDFARLARSD